MNDLDKKLISIVMPSYNDEKFIPQAIQSVLAQTHTLWELIIIDDNSTDTSRDIISAYCKKDQRITLFSNQKRSGVGKARNLATKKAQGKYIAFLDSDDLWHPEKLKTQINFMQKNELAFTYGSYRLTDENDQKLGTFTIPQQTISYTDLLKSSDIGCLTAIYDTEKLGKRYMPEILRGQDYALWLEILKQLKTATGMQEILATYRIRKRPFLRHKIRVAYYRWRIYQKIEKLSLPHTIYYFLQYIYYGIKKHRQQISKKNTAY